MVDRRWRDYRTEAGRCPVRDFLRGLPEDARAEVLAGMKEVKEEGQSVARHLRGEIYEVRVRHDRMAYRILFANEGKKGRILLALEGFTKKSQRTPPRVIDGAIERLKDWRARGRDTSDDS